MHGDLVTQTAMTALRCALFVVSHRSRIKSLAAYMVLFTMLFVMQPISARSGDFSNISDSPEKLMYRLKEHLKLTEEQEIKIQPIIDESFKKRSEILKNGGQGGKSEKSALQELQWSTDMQIGKILTDDQMKEYEKLREEESEKKMQRSDVQGGRGKHTGGMRGF